MTTQHIETLIIGAGQAGLSTGYHLQRMNRPVSIVDANERIGDNWRRHYDSLRLYTPAKYSGLSGMAFPAKDRWSYPGRDDVAEFLERYAIQWDLPVRMSTRVDRLVARPGGGYSAFIGGDTVTCDNVVVATGTFGRTPNVPAFATELDPGIRQLHSSKYRRPEQLQPGSCAGGGRFAFRHRYRVRDRADAPDDPVWARLRPDPSAVGFATDPLSVTRLGVRVAPRRHQKDADRPKGDAAHPFLTVGR